jgi:hypothetical protein
MEENRGSRWTPATTITTTTTTTTISFASRQATIFIPFIIITCGNQSKSIPVAKSHSTTGFATSVAPTQSNNRSNSSINRRENVSATRTKNCYS